MCILVERRYYFRSQM